MTENNFDLAAGAAQRQMHWWTTGSDGHAAPAVIAAVGCRVDHPTASVVASQPSGRSAVTVANPPVFQAFMNSSMGTASPCPCGGALSFR